MIVCVLLCYPVSIHMSQLLSTGRPIVIGCRGFGCEDKSFGGVTFDIIFCMSCFNHVPSGDTLCRDAICSWSKSLGW